MTPIRGWAPRGKPLIAHAPFGKWRTLTFLAALRHDRIDAPCVLDGPINGESFTAYVTQFLVPTLSPGDVVIMDDLGSHKGKAVRKAIRAAGAKLIFLPPYSPTSIRSNRCSPNSSCCSTKPPNDPLKLATHRQSARRLPTTRMCRIPQKQWLCFSLNENESKGRRFTVQQLGQTRWRPLRPRLLSKDIGPKT